MKKKLYVVGAGGVGGHIVTNLELYNLYYNDIYFVDDDPLKLNNSFIGIEVVGNVNYLLDINEEVDVIIGIAFPKLKYELYHRISKNPYLSFPTLIASNSWISKNVRIGKGSIIYPNCSINYESSIGEFIVMNMNCAIGHEVSIDDFSSLAPGVCIGGYTHLGKCVDMGIGCSTLQGISIGSNSIVGGKAMVTKSFSANSKIVGVPAKAI